MTNRPTRDADARRTDARRNRERLVTVAEEVFGEAGPDASLNEIARRAGVGPGTLYRHFPNRPALLAAVLRERIETLCELADELRALESADEALGRWVRAFQRHARVNQGLGGALLTAEAEGAGALGVDCHQRILDAASSVLTRAQREGAARADLEAADLVQLVVGVALSTVHGTDPDQPDRLTHLLLDAAYAPHGGYGGTASGDGKPPRGR